MGYFARMFRGGASASQALPPGRLLHLDALRAAAASCIAWHHFTSYSPLADGAAVAWGDWLTWIHDHTRVAQVFFAVSGFVLSQTMTHRVWNARQAQRFVLYRYCRLGLPYLAALLLALAAGILARDVVPESLSGSPPTWDQMLAHVFFLQHILGYESLSAGLWFVCINFQLGLILALLLLSRDWLCEVNPSQRWAWSDLPLWGGGILAMASLFYFNRDSRWDAWAVYFFAQFYAGVVAHQAVSSPRARIYLVCFGLAVMAALYVQWRLRLVNALLTAIVLYLIAAHGRMECWPESRVVRWLGKTSYSLFLVHFPVLLAVSAVWVSLDLSSPGWGAVGICAAYLGSLGVAGVFYQLVERPAHALSRLFAHDGRLSGVVPSAEGV